MPQNVVFTNSVSLSDTESSSSSDDDEIVTRKRKKRKPPPPPAKKKKKKKDVAAKQRETAARARAKRRKEEEAERKKAEAARLRKKKAEAARLKKQEAEAARLRKKAEEEARQAAAAEEARRKAEEEARQAAAADEEAQRQAEEEARQAAEESQRKAEQEARQAAEEAQRKAAEEAQRKAAEEAQKKKEANIPARQIGSGWPSPGGPPYYPPYGSPFYPPYGSGYFGPFGPMRGHPKFGAPSFGIPPMRGHQQQQQHPPMAGQQFLNPGSQQQQPPPMAGHPPMQPPPMAGHRPMQPSPMTQMQPPIAAALQPPPPPPVPAVAASSAAPANATDADAASSAPAAVATSPMPDFFSPSPFPNGTTHVLVESLSGVSVFEATPEGIVLSPGKCDEEDWMTEVTPEATGNNDVPMSTAQLNPREAVYILSRVESTPAVQSDVTKVCSMICEEQRSTVLNWLLANMNFAMSDLNGAKAVFPELASAPEYNELFNDLIGRKELVQRIHSDTSMSPENRDMKLNDLELQIAMRKIFPRDLKNVALRIAFIEKCFKRINGEPVPAGACNLSQQFFLRCLVANDAEMKDPETEAWTLDQQLNGVAWFFNQPRHTREKFIAEQCSRAPAEWNLDKLFDFIVCALGRMSTKEDCGVSRLAPLGEGLLQSLVWSNLKQQRETERLNASRTSTGSDPLESAVYFCHAILNETIKRFPPEPLPVGLHALINHRDVTVQYLERKIEFYKSQIAKARAAVLEMPDSYRRINYMNVVQRAQSRISWCLDLGYTHRLVFAALQGVEGVPRLEEFEAMMGVKIREGTRPEAGQQWQEWCHAHQGMQTFVSTVFPDSFCRDWLCADRLFQFWDVVIQSESWNAAIRKAEELGLREQVYQTQKYSEWYLETTSIANFSDASLHKSNEPLLNEPLDAMFREIAGESATAFLNGRFAEMKDPGRMLKIQKLFLFGYWVPLIQAVESFRGLYHRFWNALAVILDTLDTRPIMVIGQHETLAIRMAVSATAAENDWDICSIDGEPYMPTVILAPAVISYVGFHSNLVPASLSVSPMDTHSRTLAAWVDGRVDESFLPKRWEPRGFDIFFSVEDEKEWRREWKTDKRQYSKFRRQIRKTPTMRKDMNLGLRMRAS